MIIEKFNIFKKKKEKQQYFLVLHNTNGGDYSVLINLTHGIEDFILTDKIDSTNINNLKDKNNNIEKFTTIELANKRLDNILHKYNDVEWSNKNNWTITTFDELNFLFTTNKFNI